MKRLTTTLALCAALLAGAAAALVIVHMGLLDASPKAAAPLGSPAPALVNAPQVALVIGNGSYLSAPLSNPVNDSRLMAQALRESGFLVVERHNLSQNEMRQAVREFGDALQKNGTALFYYAGHGVQLKGRNFLIPVSADIRHEDEIEDQSVDANLVLAKMDSAKSRFNVVILDACRNNPFAKGFRIAATGLAPMDAPSGTLVAFSTAPGQVAEDGEGGSGLYTRNLLINMRTPGLRLEDVFKRTRGAVRAESDGRQIPWESSSLESDFYFQPPEADAVRSTADTESLQPPVSLAALQANAVPSSVRHSASALAPLQAQGAPFRVPSFVDSSGPAPGTLQAKAAPSPAQSLSDDSAPAPSTVQANAPPSPTQFRIDNAAPATAGGRAMRNDGSNEMIAAYRRSDYALANRLARQLAERGHALAQSYLGEMYRLGRGAQASYPEALQWYRRAAEQGNVAAQEWVGKIYFAGLGIPRDYPEALKWFRRAADQGSSVAENNIGTMFRSGLGVERSDANALHWFELAAAAGNPEAQYNLQMLKYKAH
jgi:TPR repeat protein